MESFEAQRRSMIDLQLKSRGILSSKVLTAMSNVPRERFVGSENINDAYNDGPVSIGSGQTISQPYMVAVMTEALLLTDFDKVLEIGTGSGYQTAVLREITTAVYSIERIAALADTARKVLCTLGYDDIFIKVGDGTLGWPEEAPFDAIIVTSGAPGVPEILLNHLNDGGRMIIPVGSRSLQHILRITRNKDNFNTEKMLSCVFVPLIGEGGWQKNEI